MKKVVIWGTGGNAQEVVRLFPHDAYTLVAFVDNNPARREQPFHGRQVVAPSQLPLLDFDVLMIASCFHKEIREQAVALGVDAKISLPTNSFHFQKHAGTLDPEQTALLNAVPWWYHAFEILPGVVTPGVCAYKPRLLDFPELKDLSDRRILDIGAWDGPYTLEMTRRGAQVTAFDIQPSSNSGFDTMCRLNAIRPEHICANVYDLCPERHGVYDVVTFFGVYYHLKNPLAALANINSVLQEGGLVVIEGALLEGAHLIDSRWAGRADALAALSDIPLAYYVEHSFDGDSSNWWVPNMACLKQWITGSGFEILSFDTMLQNTRSVCLARKIGGVGEEHVVI